MPAVPPVGDPGTVGLLLPTVPPAEFPVQNGRTIGTNCGITYGTTDWLTQVCREAENAGAGALWATDHLFWGRPMLECTTTLAVAAAATRRATLGTCVLQLPLRSPAAVAKQAATLQVLSGGRFVLGVGSGSHRGEYDAAGAGPAFGERGRRLDEAIAAVRAAWATGGELATRYRQEPAPAPVPVPVWIGGPSAAARRRAAIHGDGWVPLFTGPDDLAIGVARLREEAAAAGRGPVTVAVVVMIAVGDDPGVHGRGTSWLSNLYGIPPKAFDRHLVSGSAARCADAVGRFMAAGAEHVAIMVAGDDALTQFSRLAEAVGTGRHPRVAGHDTTTPRRAARPRPEARTEVPA